MTMQKSPRDSRRYIFSFMAGFYQCHVSFRACRCTPFETNDSCFHDLSLSFYQHDLGIVFSKSWSNWITFSPAKWVITKSLKPPPSRFSLKLTFSPLQMDGWNTIFLLGRPIFREGNSPYSEIEGLKIIQLGQIGHL